MSFFELTRSILIFWKTDPEGAAPAAETLIKRLMGRSKKPVEGWTDEKEQFLQDCAENNVSWVGSPLIKSKAEKNYAKKRLYDLTKRPVSPKKETTSTTSNMGKSTPPSTSINREIDKLTAKVFSDLAASISKNKMFLLDEGVDNPNSLIALTIAKDLPLNDKTTTVTAVMLLDLLASVHDHPGYVKARLIEAFTPVRKDGSGGKPTSAICKTEPTILGMLKAKHGLDKTNAPDETNFEMIKKSMKKKAGLGASAEGDGVSIALGKMFVELKKLGDKQDKLSILPTPAELGAKPGNMNDGKPLRYILDHFNNSDGTLSPQPIPLCWDMDKVNDRKIAYGYLIAIGGTENNINTSDTPTAKDSATEKKNLFKMG